MLRTQLTGVLLVANFTSVVCAAGAILLLWRGRNDGWGWLLVMAALTHTSPSSGK